MRRFGSMNKSVTPGQALQNRAILKKRVKSVVKAVKSVPKKIVKGVKAVGKGAIGTLKKGINKLKKTKSVKASPKPGAMYNAQRSNYEKAMNSAMRKGGSNGVGVGR